MIMDTGAHSSQTDVLIIGAGPSGLMAAQALAHLGVSVKIVDRRDPGTQYGNADGLQPRTLEIWQSYGMLDKFTPKAAAMHAIIGYEQGKGGNDLIRSIPSPNVVVHSRFPFELTASIETIEETLRTSMEEAGTRLEQPISPLSIDFISGSIGSGREKTHPVKVVLQHLAPRERSRKNGASLNGHCSIGMFSPDIEVVQAKYVIGADGAHSWVRRHLGIPMEGDQTEYVWGVTDVNIDTDFPDCRFKCVIQSSKGAIIIIPREGEKIRIYVQLSPKDSIKTQDGRLDKTVLSPEIVRANVLQRIRDGLSPFRVEFKRVFWCTIFSVPQKVAKRYSFQDRIFIVGDACHTHSPKAGQGANASMGDSHNLAWKIAYVLRGWAKQSLLDTYEDERRTYAQELIAFDKKISHSLDGGTAADYQSMLCEQNMFTSGVGVHYKSRLTEPGGNRYALGLKAGERLPPSPVVRLGDWQPMNLQDIVPSNGLFKLIVFPRDILLSSQKVRLSQFAEALDDSLRPELRERLAINTVISSTKEHVHWKDVPPPLQDWKRVFISDETGAGGAYDSFEIAPEGAAILVRPDGYISLLAELSSASAHQVTSFLKEL